MAFAALRAALSGPSKQDEEDKSMLLEMLNTSVTQFLKAHSGGPTVPVARHNEQALEICSALEDILNHGLRASSSSTGSSQDAQYGVLWEFLSNISHATMIETLQDLPLEDDIARCKAWIRTALNDGLFGSYMESLIGDSGGSLKSFYTTGAFLRDPEFEKPEILCTILKSIEGFAFNLSIGGLCEKPGAVKANDWSDVAAAVASDVMADTTYDATNNPLPIAPQSPRRTKKSNTPRKKKEKKRQPAHIFQEDPDGRTPAPELPSHIEDLLQPESVQQASNLDTVPQSLIATDSTVRVNILENDVVGISMRFKQTDSQMLQVSRADAEALHFALGSLLLKHQNQTQRASGEAAEQVELTQIERTTTDVSSKLPSDANVQSSTTQQIDPQESTEAAAGGGGVEQVSEIKSSPPGVSDPMAAAVAEVRPGIIDPMAATGSHSSSSPTTMDWMILETARLAQSANSKTIDVAVPSDPVPLPEINDDDSEEETF